MNVSGLSPVMQKLATQVRLAAETDASVFIVGESGAGKEVVARAIHEASERRDHPFIAVNCGAISGSLAHAELFGHEKGSFTGAVAQNAGYFESASGGTLFLDEVTEMPPDMQVHFLRVLETGTYQRVGGTDLLRANARILCASNRDPAASVADGRLRQDFLHRLLVIPLRVPPLREREGDAVTLARHFLDELNARHGTGKTFSPRMLQAIGRHEWPGNVRELRNAVQRAYILCDEELDAELPRARRAPRRVQGRRPELPGGHRPGQRAARLHSRHPGPSRRRQTPDGRNPGCQPEDAIQPPGRLRKGCGRRLSGVPARAAAATGSLRPPTGRNIYRLVVNPAGAAGAASRAPARWAGWHDYCIVPGMRRPSGGPRCRRVSWDTRCKNCACASR
ncbi:sigma 54-interacting transcriptional regulator [Achromobacter xylosoxidans]|uniref:sigma 54-interacting transcriptional regulator n=2 Tax=Alcaligenes xylosoxydans xylosoxydans TaxID=85698 RepID=UPI001F133C04|nr:sigma-54 dependent transcriptional regulator [Achromobacter xylosoxidans]